METLATQANKTSEMLVQVNCSYLLYRPVSNADVG